MGLDMNRTAWPMWFLTVAGFVCTAGFTGWCETAPEPSTVQQADIVPFYIQRISPLVGKTIVLDPGHGGEDPGAVSPGGLTEKELNLRIGRILKRMLEKYGARVLVTRTGDGTYVSLGNRVAQAQEARCDLFVSLHHNATYRQDVKNKTEVYYSMLDPLTSRNLAARVAESLHCELKLDYGIFPAIYFVLRNLSVPAILGEPLYMHLKDCQRELRTFSFCFREARGYFKGIRDYFSLGVPDIQPPISDSPRRYGRSPGTIRCTVSGENLEADRVHANLDGHRQPLPVALHDNEVVIHLDDLSNGPHVLDVQVGNIHGNYSKKRRYAFTVAHPPYGMDVQYHPRHRYPRQEFLHVTCSLNDQRGQPLGDGIPVTLESSHTVLAAEPFLTSGTVSAVVSLDRPHHHPSSLVSTDSTPVTVRVTVEGRRFEKTVNISKTRTRSIPPATIVQGRVTDDGGQPLAGVQVKKAGDDSVFSTSSTGHYTVLASEHDLIVFSKAGYFGNIGTIRSSAEVVLQPICRELLGTRITLSARKERTAALSYLNRMTVKLLEYLLRRSGAEVKVGSRGIFNRSYLQKAMGSNRFKSAWFIELAAELDDRMRAGDISHLLPGEPYCFHYPGSKGGTRFSKAFLYRRIGTSGDIDGHHLNCSNYAVINTSCPAILIYPGINHSMYATGLGRQRYFTQTALDIVLTLVKAVQGTLSERQEERIQSYLSPMAATILRIPSSPPSGMDTCRDEGTW